MDTENRPKPIHFSIAKHQLKSPLLEPTPSPLDARRRHSPLKYLDGADGPLGSISPALFEPVTHVGSSYYRGNRMRLAAVAA